MKKTVPHFLLLILLSCLTALPSAAQEPCVVSLLNKTSFVRDAAGQVRIGDCIQLKVDNLNRFIRQKPHDANIILFIDNIGLTAIRPFQVDTLNNHIFFHITRKDDANKSWSLFYRNLNIWNKNDSPIPLTVSIGYHNSGAVKSTVTIKEFVLMKPSAWWQFIIGVVIILAVFIILALRTPILRDNMTQNAPFSLARAQLAFWTLIILTSFMYIFFATAEAPNLSNTTLTLLGISIGTVTAARVIDISHQKNNSMNVGKVSRNILIDIISDPSGISIHRFQMVLWTVILGAIYVFRVYVYCEMAEFSDNLLILMGISGGTYLGLKIPENPISQRGPGAGAGGENRETPAKAENAI